MSTEHVLREFYNEMYCVHTQPGNAYDIGDHLYHLTVRKHLDHDPTHPISRSVAVGGPVGGPARRRCRMRLWGDRDQVLAAVVLPKTEGIEDRNAG